VAIAHRESLRRIEPIEIAGIEPGGITDNPPIFEWAAPEDLLIDGAYQRDLTDAGKKLIRRIVENWSWARFKPPTAVLTDRGLELLDGQHVALAALLHPGITEIVVQVVDVPDQADRAAAFVGINRDRRAVTPTELHFAEVTAGNEDAMTVDQVCTRAGVVILRTKPASGKYERGETLAAPAIARLINRTSAMRARQILEVLVKANRAPIRVQDIRAVEMLMTESEYADEIDAEMITDAILRTDGTAENEAKVFAAAHKVPLFKALGIQWFRAKRGRKRAA
jgi:hypothetical protein